MLFYRYAKHGGKSVIELHFQHAGDTLEMHKHFKGNFHDVVVKRGAATIYGPNDRWSATPKNNKLVKLSTEQQEHEIVALEDDTIVWNVYHEPMPSHDAKLDANWEPYS
jgi:hypothetical protein